MFTYGLRIDNPEISDAVYEKYRAELVNEGQVVEGLVTSLASSSSYVAEKIHFLIQFGKSILLRHALVILDTVERNLSGTAENSLFVTRINVLKTIFTITKLLRLIRDRFAYVEHRCIENEERLTQMAVHFIEAVEDPMELRYLLSEKNSVGESVLDLISFQDNHEIFMLPAM